MPSLLPVSNLTLHVCCGPAQLPAPASRLAVCAAAKMLAASRPASGKANGKASPAGKASGAGGAQGKQVLANMWSKAAPKKEKTVRSDFDRGHVQ